MKKVLIYSLPLIIVYFIATIVIWMFADCRDAGLQITCGLFIGFEIFSLMIVIPLYVGLVFVPLFWKENKETKVIKWISKIIALSWVVVVVIILLASYWL